VPRQRGTYFLNLGETKMLNAKNIGYKFATNLTSNKALAHDVLNAYPMAHEELPKELQQDLQAGMQQRFIENNPKHDQVYLFNNGAYLPLDEKQLAEATKDKREVLHMTVGFAMSFTQQAFGQLKTSNKSLHSIVKEVRDACNKYVSKTLQKFVALLNEVYNEKIGKTTDRKPVEAFDVRLAETMADLRKKCTNAKTRGDTTADDARLARAIKAFEKEWKA